MNTTSAKKGVRAGACDPTGVLQRIPFHSDRSPAATVSLALLHERLAGADAGDRLTGFSTDGKPL